MSQQAGERTEKATPKKRRDARERGQVVKSAEVNTAFCSIVMLGLMVMIFPHFFSQLTGIYTKFLGTYITDASSEELNIQAAGRLFLNVLLAAVPIILPLFGVAVLAGLMINFLQVGFLFTTKTLAPKMERINPLKGFQRIFSMRTLTELVKAAAKMICLGYILYSDYKKLLEKFPSLMGTDIYRSTLWIMDTAFMLALKMCVALAVIAAIDYLLQWWKHEKDLMMTKQEIKDEYKAEEGDPQIKRRIKQKQRQMSAMRMMDSVPKADVVITNPTHYAVALKYEEGAAGAPKVVAKGQDFLARKIREVARENGVEIVENRPLAQALYRYCEIGDEVPEEFYQVVADILVYVYKLKNKLPAAAERRRAGAN